MKEGDIVQIWNDSLASMLGFRVTIKEIKTDGRWCIVQDHTGYEWLHHMSELKPIIE